MTEPRTTSHSEVESFLACERRHYYSYGLKLQGKFTSEALERGILIHHALREYYNSLKDGIPHSEATTLAFQALAGLTMSSSAFDPVKLQMQCVWLLGLYFDHYKHDVEHIEVLEVETDYSIRITDDYYLPVKIDLIYRDLRTNEIVITDHKVVDRFYSDDESAIKPQLPKYMAGLLSEKIKVDRCEYNFIRHPKNAIERFLRQNLEINTARIRRTAEEQIRAANRIRSLREAGLAEWSRRALRNTGACGNCPFKLLCGTELAGKPTADIIEFEYRPKTRRIEMNS